MDQELIVCFQIFVPITSDVLQNHAGPVLVSLPLAGVGDTPPPPPHIPTPTLSLSILKKKKKKKSLVFDSYGFGRILILVELGLDSIVF